MSIGWLLTVAGSHWACSDVAVVVSTADTSLFEINPDNNLGGMNRLPGGTTRGTDFVAPGRARLLFRFDLTGTIPSNGIVTSATLNLIVVGTALSQVASNPTLIGNWQANLWREYGSPWLMLGISLVLFPKLALGLSGFETGVAVMPLIRGDVQQRIRNTRRLLLTAALIMSVFLV